jgi:hypothetical protein
MKEEIKSLSWQVCERRDVGDKPGEAQALCTLATAYMDRGNARCAVAHFQEAAAIYQELGNRLAESHVISKLCRAYVLLDQIERVRAYFEQEAHLCF